ncbi:hypothetical protein [Mycobacterium intracellulare]|uniref:hypothetical protein n=1 Tax=Mycobacterium intracellulare TaxID=1767 RepID=UPI001EEDC4DA|nr:hypothetical protein [Mycobacterium intracellulare]MEE3755282.1 hypothetical protein [Mycobacterium intracellulare]
MIKFLTTLNPLTLTLRLGRGAVQQLFKTLRWKLILTAVVAAAVALATLAGIYTLTAPLDAARELAASLRGGAPNMPPSRSACIPNSPAVIDGHYTPEAQRIVSDIPPNATINPATAYLLYRWSHQDQPWKPSWDEWDGYLHDHQIGPTASDIDIAESVDPRADYTPYLVAARSTTVALAAGGPIAADKKQIAAMAYQVYRDCRRSDEQRKATTPADPGAERR